MAVCAVLNDRPLVEADPGPFAVQAVWQHRGDAQIYPASVCKMFYLAALAAFEAGGRLALDDEDHRATKAMIGISSNDATTYLLGRLTGAFDGPVLDPAALEEWVTARHQVQDWLEDVLALAHKRRRARNDAARVRREAHRGRLAARRTPEPAEPPE